MNRISANDYSVPSLSLASSRNKRAIPTKDTNVRVEPTKPRTDIMDRLSRPPIFHGRSRRSDLELDSNRVEGTSYISSYREISQTNERREEISTNLNRNVYLMREQSAALNEPATFRARNNDIAPQIQTQHNIPGSRSRANLAASSSTSMLRNPEGSRIFKQEVDREIEFRKIDVNKSLFERKIQKLFQEADFYEQELNGMCSDDMQEQLETSLQELEQIKNDTFALGLSSCMM